MLKNAMLLILLLLIGCNGDTQAEKNVQDSGRASIIVKDIIALNHKSCLLSDKGDVYCWKPTKQGALRFQDLKPVDLGMGVKALGIYGNSGNIHYFDTGYHACALLDNNSIRCWGDITDDTVFDAQSVFDLKPRKMNKNNIPSFPVKDSILQKMGQIKTIITNHSVVCTIDKKDTLYCPHPHLAFLNGKSGVKHAVFGEILSCVQNIMDNAVECYDMRGGTNAGPTFIKLNGEFWPKLFDFRLVYSAGIAFIKTDGGALYWAGPLPGWDKFPGMYNIETTPFKLPGQAKATAIHMSESTTCLQLNDGAASCWGFFVKGDNKAILDPPGVRVTFGKDRKVTDIALGESYNCFLLSDNSIECFMRKK